MNIITLGLLDVLSFVLDNLGIAVIVAFVALVLSIAGAWVTP